jgi:hypothetical protein
MTKKKNLHNQDGNHDDNKVRITIFFFFFELTDRKGPAIVDLNITFYKFRKLETIGNCSFGCI